MSDPLNILSSALMEEFRPVVYRLRRLGWDATVAMEQSEPGVRIVSIDVKLAILVPIETTEEA